MRTKDCSIDANVTTCQSAKSKFILHNLLVMREAVKYVDNEILSDMSSEPSTWDKKTCASGMPVHLLMELAPLGPRGVAQNWKEKRRVGDGEKVIVKGPGCVSERMFNRQDMILNQFSATNASGVGGLFRS